MKIYLCQGDIDLLKAIANRKITDDANLNDSEARSARYLYNQDLIGATPLEGSDAGIEVLEITPKGEEKLKDIFRAEEITVGKSIDNAKTGQMFAFDAGKLAKLAIPIIKEAVEKEGKFNNALEADAHNCDTRELA